MARLAPLLLALTTTGALLAGSPATTVTPVADAATAPTPRPNVVLITVDDMRADDLEVMPQTRRLLSQLDLTEFVSNHPVCCPARAQLLTGQFAQHNGVHHNTSTTPWSGYQALRDKDNTVATWFQRSGYHTTLIGKFVNGWKVGESRRPAGWSQWTPLVKNAYSAFRYSYLRNDTVRRAPDGLHTNDFVTAQTRQRIDAAEGRDRQPFFVWTSYVAPHHMIVSGAFAPPVPAARHVGAFDGAVPLSEAKPSYEEPTGGEVARAAYQDAAAAPTARERVAASDTTVRHLNQARWESLLSVDEGVARIVSTLRRRGELANTVVVFTSDNGFLLGEHGQLGKNSYLEESLRVPLLATGPGVGTGTSPKNAMMVDIAPSLSALAGVTAGRPVDGRTDLFSATGGWPDETGVLVQAGSDDAPWIWRGTRTSRWTYAENLDGSSVLYDRVNDPYQLDNLAGTGLPEEAALADLTPSLDPTTGTGAG